MWRIIVASNKMFLGSMNLFTRFNICTRIHLHDGSTLTWKWLKKIVIRTNIERFSLLFYFNVHHVKCKYMIYACGIQFSINKIFSHLLSTSKTRAVIDINIILGCVYVSLKNNLLLTSQRSVSTDLNAKFLNRILNYFRIFVLYS